MDAKRPINLKIWTLKFPIMAISSILHRITGIVLFIGIPFALLALKAIMSTPEAFRVFQQAAVTGWGFFLTWAVISAVIYHFLAGVRHIVMDFGWCESLKQGRFTAITVITLSIIFSFSFGVWLW